MVNIETVQFTIRLDENEKKSMLYRMKASNGRDRRHDKHSHQYSMLSKEGDRFSIADRFCGSGTVKLTLSQISITLDASKQLFKHSY